MIQRIYYLDGIRGILALSVAISHIIGGVTGWAANRAFVGAYLAVDIFFILSGFVLARLLLSKHYSFTSFFWMRFWRLWPLHVAAVLLSIVIYEFNRSLGRYAPPDGSFKDVSLFLENAFFLMTMGIKDIAVINPPSWSIGIEFWSSAILLPFLIRLSPAMLYTISLLAYLIIAHHNGGLATYATAYPFVSLGLLKGIAGMTFGIAIYKNQKVIDTAFNRLDVEWHVAILYLTLIYIATGIIWQTNSLLNFTVILAVVPMLGAQSFARVSTLNVFLSSKPIVWLGTISFSLYLIHTPILVFVDVPRIAKSVGDVNATILISALCLGIAALVHYYFEAPVAGLIKRLSARSPSRKLAKFD